MNIINILSTRYILLLVVVSILVIVTSCQEKEILSFTTPSTYRFNSPTLVDKAYYVRDTTNNQYIKVNDTLETFVVDNEDLADSLNSRFKVVFASESIIAFEFLSDKEVNIQFAKFDAKLNKYIDQRSQKSAYKFEGNAIKIDLLPNLNINLDNFFLELRQCYHAADRLSYPRSTPQDTTFSRNYDLRPCSFANDRDYINAMQPNVGRIDTVAVYKLDVIYSKY